MKKILLFSMVVISGLASLSSCGGGSGSSSDSAPVPPFVMANELRRVGATYKTFQDLLDVVGVINDQMLRAHAGQSLSCTGGGTVSYSVTEPTQSGGSTTGSVHFTHCVQALGTYDGELDLSWCQQCVTQNHAFDSSIGGSLTVNGSLYSLSNVTGYQYQQNSQSGFVTTSLNLDTRSSFSPATGEGFNFSPGARATMQYQPGANTMTLNNVVFGLGDNLSNSLTLGQQGGISVVRTTPGIQSVGIGLPSTGTLEFVHVDQPKSWGGPADSSAGTVTLTLQYSDAGGGQRTAQGSAQWSDIVANPLFTTTD